MTKECYDNMRQQYQPKRIRVLFVGESRPAGGTFFYRGDSNLCRYTQQAFEKACGRNSDTPSEFLASFMSKGCYLDDLCLEPVNRNDARRRRKQRNAGVCSLATRMRAYPYRPDAVICVMRAIEGHVRRAMEGLNPRDVLFYCAPFPAQGHQREYVEQLTAALIDLSNKGILDLDC
ncbi:MAG: hypothetical protein JSV65_12820 [Armatimonadota bacterium]|nr:MAG: hypothetical protein JSV65_12820 [Armatimonadota bacterium]